MVGLDFGTNLSRHKLLWCILTFWIECLTTIHRILDILKIKNFIFSFWNTIVIFFFRINSWGYLWIQHISIAFLLASFFISPISRWTKGWYYTMIFSHDWCRRNNILIIILFIWFSTTVKTTVIKRLWNVLTALFLLFVILIIKINFFCHYIYI